MCIQSPVRDRDQTPVERSFALSALVTGDQKHRLPLGVERESSAPDATPGIEPQLLHVRMLRAVQRVDPRSPCTGPEHLDNASLRQQLDPYLGG